MKQLVSELSGAELDYWVAKANGFIKAEYKKKDVFIRKIPGDAITVIPVAAYMPSTNPAQGWPIIEREKISIFPQYSENWYSSKGLLIVQYGETSLIAAMRCYVASVYGGTVGSDNE